MRKILWTITAVGALAVPVGMVAAQTDDDVVVDETPTTVVCDQDQLREQLRLHDGTGDQVRDQVRAQLQDCDGCDQLQIREQVRRQVRVEDGQGDMVRTQTREQVRDEDCGTCTGDQQRAQVQDGTGAGVGAGGMYQQHDRRQAGR